MADFNISDAKTSGAEGGYANDSKDRGGETICAIARQANPHFIGWPLVDHAVSEVCRRLGLTTTKDAGAAVWKQVDAELASQHPEFKQLVKDFRKERYWTPLGLDSEPDQELADEVYDSSINEGESVAKARLERARDA
jgi:lysozyme family protein